MKPFELDMFEMGPRVATYVWYKKFWSIYWSKT